jgi:hypothetical protein
VSHIFSRNLADSIGPHVGRSILPSVHNIFLKKYNFELLVVVKVVVVVLLVVVVVVVVVVVEIVVVVVTTLLVDGK